jgi:hypothetical protein
MNVLVAQGLGRAMGWVGDECEMFSSISNRKCIFPCSNYCIRQIKRLANIITDKIAGHAVDRRIDSC